jgi:predicted DCC family thiol-disulfide oxidoreductase YuxK
MSMDDRSRASSRSADSRARHARAPAIAAGCAAVALTGLAAAAHSAWLAIAAVVALVLAVRLTLRVRVLGDPVISAWPFLAAQLAVSGFYTTLAFGTCCSPVSNGSALAAAAMLFVAAGLWFASLRPFALVVATAGHAAALVVWPSWPLAFTSLLVLGSSILFLDDRPGSRLVVWDDTCGFCRSSVTLLRRLDWLHVHRFAGSSDERVLAESGVTREEAEEELKLSVGRRTLGGFDAIRGILESLPVGYLWARILMCPPLDAIGRAAYRRIAAKRHCLLPQR